MSPFDIAVMIFFGIMVLKAICDASDFWKEMDEEATTTKNVVVAPKHIPAPSRPSPKKLNPSMKRTATEVPVPAKVQPITRKEERNVRPAVVASYNKAIKTVPAPIKKATMPRRSTVA